MLGKEHKTSHNVTSNQDGNSTMDITTTRADITGSLETVEVNMNKTMDVIQ